MNKKIKKEWIAALRSGKYKKGRNKLKSRANQYGTPYCCLGVLCDIAIKHNIVDTDVFDNETTLPSSVYEWAGLDSHNPRLYRDKDDVTCTEANDDKKLSFAEIADLIEKNL